MKLFEKNIQIKKDDLIYENNIDQSRLIIKKDDEIINIYSWCILGIDEGIDEDHDRILIKINGSIKEYPFTDCAYMDLIKLFLDPPEEKGKSKKEKSKKENQDKKSVKSD